MSDTKLHFGVMVAVPKITNETIKQAMDLADCGMKPYILEYGTRTPLMTSVVDENLVQAIEVLNGKGIQCFVIGGQPTPPICPPKGCQ